MIARFVAVSDSRLGITMPDDDEASIRVQRYSGFDSQVAEHLFRLFAVDGLGTDKGRTDVLCPEKSGQAFGSREIQLKIKTGLSVGDQIRDDWRRRALYVCKIVLDEKITVTTLSR